MADKLVCHTCAAQILIWIPAIRTMRINQCIRLHIPVVLLSGIIHITRNLVMICHNYSHALRLRIRHSLECRYTIVTGDNRINTIRHRLFHDTNIHAISILYTLRNIIWHLCTCLFQSRIQYVIRSNPIHIIIRYNSNFFVIFELVKNYFASLRKILHKCRIM